MPQENTLMKQIREEIHGLDNAALSARIQEARHNEKMMKIVNEELKKEVWARMGTDETLRLDESGFGARVEHRNVWHVPLHKAEEIIQDRDTLSVLSKGIDMKRAKEILDSGVYQKLEAARESLRTVKALVFGRIKE